MLCLYSSLHPVAKPPHRGLFTNKGDTASTQCYSSYLIKSDNMLVTVMLTINHTRTRWNWEAGGRRHDECCVLSVSWLVIQICPFSALHVLALPEMMPYYKIAAAGIITHILMYPFCRTTNLKLLSACCIAQLQVLFKCSLLLFLNEWIINCDK